MLKTLARERDKSEILQRLKELRHDSQRRWGRMSAHQMVCHLSDAYRLVTGEKTAVPAPTPLPRSVMKCIALYVPLRWPPGIRTTPEFDQEIGGTRPVEFETDLAALSRIVDDITSEQRRAFSPLSIRSSARCPSGRGCAGAISTPIIISVSSGSR